MNKQTRIAIRKRLDDEDIEQKLRAMTEDDTLNTAGTYSANVMLYPNHEIPFIDRHIAYLMCHPNVELRSYLANLRLMLKKR